MNAELLEKLQKPFGDGDIKQRAGRGQMTFSYVPIGDVIRRLLVTTAGDYRWEIVRLDYMPVPPARQGSPEFMWVCHGRLHVISDDAVFYDGVGTHPAMDEESPKAAESDAFKRAAVKVGVCLHLYDDPHSGNGQNARQEPRRQEAGVQGGGKWLGPGRCPTCECVPNGPHKPNCQGVSE